MKAHYILFAVAALVVSAACTKTNEQPEPEGIQMTFRAYQEGAQETKTTVQDGGTQVYWEPSDEIKVFFKSSSGRFVSQNSELAGVADFSGTLNILVGANEGFGATNQTWGLYPYRADATYDGEYVTTTLPASQTGRAGSFAKNTHICLARSGGNDLAFYNVTGGLRFSLTQEGIKSVTFEGNNGESLAGKIKLTFEGGVPAVKEVSEGENTLTLTAPSSGTFQTGKWYYIETIPGTLSKGFKMVFSKGNETAKISSSGSVTISRGKYGSLTDADEGLIFKGNGGSDEPDPSSVIQFADPIAKYACVEKFDTNGDGEVSYEEAAAATSFEGLFTNWNTVTRFDEIKYFTGVTSTQGVFNGLSKLESITIPDFITSLGTFSGCTSLKTIVLPDSIISLPSSCFNACRSLISVSLPSNISDIPSDCFCGCSSLATFTLPSGIKSIGEQAFCDCKALTSIEFPAELETIGYEAFGSCINLTSISIPPHCSTLGVKVFGGCTGLSSVVLPSNMIEIPEALFSGCENLASITWPAHVTTIGREAFYGCSFAAKNYTVELPASIIKIGNRAFSGPHHIIVPSTSVVSIDASAFGDLCSYIYVPSGLIEMYKVRSNWNNYANMLRALGDYPVEQKVTGTVGEAVDLGLSVKWSSWNLGASTPEEYGSYLAWGETEPKWNYDWPTYKWCNGSSDVMTKYNTRSFDVMVDYKTVLDPEDDAASVNWGGSWRMPTDEEWTELREDCTWTWTDNYNGTGIKGEIVTASNGNTIFLPAAAYWGSNGLYHAAPLGSYWSSSLDSDNPCYVWSISFSSDDVNRDNNKRCFGRSVRPVCE